MRTLDRRRLVEGDGRFWGRSELGEDPECAKVSVESELVSRSARGRDVRGEGSLWRPAFRVAAACKEIEAERDGDRDGDSARWPSPFDAMALCCGPFAWSGADGGRNW